MGNDYAFINKEIGELFNKRAITLWLQITYFKRTRETVLCQLKRLSRILVLLTKEK